MRLIQTGVLALVALILGLFVVRPILAGRRAGGTPGAARLDDSGAARAAELPAPQPADSAVPALAAPGGRAEAGGQRQPGPDQADDPVDRLRDLIQDRRQEAVQVLQSWMNDPKDDGAGR
jgi:flagellar M-ring protein FliF